MEGIDVIYMLRRSGGIAAVARQLGISPTLAAAGAEALLPAILGGFRKHADNAGGGEGGLGSLIGMLGTLGGGTLASSVLGPDQAAPDKGNDVLGQIFGTKDVSRSVAADAADKTGIDPQILKKMLPLLAMLVGGYFSARSGGSGAAGSGGLGSMLGSVFGDKSQAQVPGEGQGGLGSMLDMNGNGNPLDDIIGMADKLFK